MSTITFRGPRAHRPWYLVNYLLNRANHRIASRNIGRFPQLAILSFDNIGLVINLEGRYESDALDTLARFITQKLDIDTNTTAVDVGANVGNHSVFFSEIFNKVVSFEPNPKVYNLLKYNSAGKNILPLNFGLSSEPSILNLSIDPKNIGASRILDQVANLKGSDMVNVEVRRLDDVSELKDQVVSLIKIDVEGHELQVLQGAAELIQAARPIVVFEQGRDVIRDGTSEVIEFLRNKNYRFYTIRSNFYLGTGIAARSIALLLRLVFGFSKNIVSTTYFHTKFYDMIIAVPA